MFATVGKTKHQQDTTAGARSSATLRHGSAHGSAFGLGCMRPMSPASDDGAGGSSCSTRTLDSPAHRGHAKKNKHVPERRSIAREQFKYNELKNDSEAYHLQQRQLLKLQHEQQQQQQRQHEGRKVKPVRPSQPQQRQDDLLVDISPPSDGLLPFAMRQQQQQHQQPQLLSRSPLADSLMSMSLLDTPIDVPTESVSVQAQPASPLPPLEPPPYTSPPTYCNTAAYSASQMAAATTDPFGDDADDGTADTANDDLANVARYGANMAAAARYSAQRSRTPIVGPAAVEHQLNSAPSPARISNNLLLPTTSDGSSSTQSRHSQSSDAVEHTSLSQLGSMSSPPSHLLYTADLEKNIYKSNGAASNAAMQSNMGASAAGSASKEATVSSMPSELYASCTYNNTDADATSAAPLNKVQNLAPRSLKFTNQEAAANYAYHKQINTETLPEQTAAAIYSNHQAVSTGGEATSQVVNQIWFEQQHTLSAAGGSSSSSWTPDKNHQQSQQQPHHHHNGHTQFVAMQSVGRPRSVASTRYDFYSSVAGDSSSMYGSVAGDHYEPLPSAAVYGNAMSAYGAASHYASTANVSTVPSMQPVLYDEVSSTSPGMFAIRIATSSLCICSGRHRGDVAAASAGTRRSAGRPSAVRPADSATHGARAAAATAAPATHAVAVPTATAADLRQLSERSERGTTGGRRAARLRRRCDAGRGTAGAAGCQLGSHAGHSVLQDRAAGSVSKWARKRNELKHTNAFCVLVVSAWPRVRSAKMPC